MSSSDKDKKESKEEEKEKESKKRKSISAPEKKKKKTQKLVPRCTSPSHFLLEPCEMKKYAADAEFPDKQRTNNLLNAVATMYYKPHETATNGSEVLVSQEYDKLEYPTLDMLLSPLRKPSVLDSWSPKEIALFEAGMCSIGKDFHAISKLIKTKTCNECVDFYYTWKKSSHYAMWKDFGKPSRKFHSGKEEQWKQIQEKMKRITKT
eukprot:TRINITY_DN326_c2_g1_i2.p1 TRINITY_DN326_c2_g1~~TRINITY_DN326_c2_g1_i2.p1  ORF type:complete len:207 (-),score=53.85 TRINITY_DN326_c2_g1_i2:1334-1954(-)